MRKLAIIGLVYMLWALPFEVLADVKEYQALSQAAKIDMKQAMDAATNRVNGVIVKAELDKHNDKTIYDLEVLSGESVFEIKVDAANANVLEVKEDKG